MSTATATPTPPRVSRMRMANLVVGPKKKPRRILVSGVEGIGKSTFAASAPSPIFLGAEDGTDQLDVSRFPTPHTLDDVFDALMELIDSKHSYQTLVIDTVDWLEPLVWEHVCKRDSNKGNPLQTIEDYGYGKGYQVALDEWRRLLKGLEDVRAQKGMEVILLAHTHLKTFKNPEGPDFDRYELKLNLKAGGVLKEWCDVVLFAAFETYAQKENPGAKLSKAKGFSTGARLIHSQRTAAYDAKSRFSLPESMPLSWEAFDAACKSNQVATPEELSAAIAEKAPQLGAELEKQVLAKAASVATDAQKLAQLLNWTISKLALVAGKQA